MSELHEPIRHGGSAAPTEPELYRVLARVGIALGITVDPAEIVVPAAGTAAGSSDPRDWLVSSAANCGILLKPIVVTEAAEAAAFVREGYPLIIAALDGSFVVIDAMSGQRFEATVFADRVTTPLIPHEQFRRLVALGGGARVFVAKKALDCDAISSSPAHEASHHHGSHVTPLRRFIGLLRMDSADIGTIVLFAFVSGVLALATPLAVESLVNVVSWGTFLQPLVVLGLILLTCLGMAGVLKVLQTFLVELIQRRQFVRIVSDLAHRFPRANQAALAGQYPRELANRLFDIMTIQKATAVLLLDGVSIVLTTVLGLVLLAFYHPFLLGFDIVLVMAMISITWLLGRGGVGTAIDESITKYRVVHWLQDVIANPSIFKTGGGETLAIQRANQLAADYIIARKRQFSVVIRQVAFAIALQVIASTAVLCLGGWLVIQGQLTLGQLVASELVVTVVVGAFAKAGKSLEKFYDLMAGVDKVGHLIDIPADPRHELGPLPEGPVAVRWSDLVFQRAASSSRIPAASIAAGARVAIVGDDVDGRSDLVRTLAGLCEPNQGVAQVGDFDATRAEIGGSGRLVGIAADKEIFTGTLRQNVDLGRPGIGQSRVREVLGQVGLSEATLHLADALQTILQSNGHPLSATQIVQLVIARAIASRPKLVIIDGLLDELASADRQRVWSTLAADDAPWTLVVATNREDVANWCQSQIFVRHR
jgi:putative ABC transport system ATP-binding protein